MKWSDINGKTIESATQLRLDGPDDTGFVRLRFTDGTACIIVATHGGYTGHSIDEYTTCIRIIEDADAYHDYGDIYYPYVEMDK